MRKIHLTLLLIVSLSLLQCSTSRDIFAQTIKPEVKNVILMIGDGMGVSQVYSGITANNGLYLEKSEFVGFSKTYSASNYITDSAAGGTAISTGTKTRNGAIGVDAKGNEVKTILEYAAENGLSTGVIASCAITHATPASFVAHQQNRNMQEEIAVDFLNSDITLFIGGGKKYFADRSDKSNLLDDLKEKGFQVALDMETVKNTTSGKLAGLVADEHPSTYPERGEFLPESLQAALNILDNNPEGFFLMVEGGRIDHACHAHDPAGSIHDTLAFDQAIDEAYSFYRKYPDETLIVVVADHETGGFGLGFGDNYFLKMDQLFKAKVTTADVLNEGVGKYDKDRKKFFDFIATNLGLDNLSLDEKIKIEQAMDLIDGSQKDAIATYAGYDSVAITVTHIMSERANMFWTTYAHSGTTVPLSAIGVGAEALGGFKDNTEVAKTLFSILEFKPTKVASTHPISLPKVINY